MQNPVHAEVERYTEGGLPRLKIRGRLDRESAPAVMDWLLTWAPRGGARVGLDLGELDFIDSAGVAMLAEVRRRFERKGRVLDLVRVSEPARKTLSLFRTSDGPSVEGYRPGLVEKVGMRAAAIVGEARAMLYLVADTFYWAVLGPFFAGRGAPRGEMSRQTLLLGANAFGIVSLLAFLIGLTLALLSAHQLRRFGANIYVADLVAITMVREMGPVLTAVIVAGRSGSAISAEIATMRGTEEIEALLAMGFVPVRFLVVPKLYAVTITQPLLTFVSVVFGILGGLVIAALSLGVPPYPFVHQAVDAIRPSDIGSGLMKSIVFGWLILVIAAHCGLRTRGGAEAVGASTTRSVVWAIFAVVIADCIFSLALYL